MKILDRICGWLIALGSVGHSIGSYLAFKTDPMELLWAESGTLAALLLAAVNLLRSGRPGDATLAWVCVGGNAAFLVMLFAFGRIIGNLVDPRVVIQSAAVLVLLGMSLRSALGASQTRRAK
jgi:hypothetical protein